MRSIVNTVCFTFLLCFGLVTMVAASDDIGKSQPGKTIKGDVLRVDGEHVTIKSHDTGETVRIHVDKNTEKNDTQIRPIVGENVIAKYDEKSNHAFSYLTDRTMQR